LLKQISVVPIGCLLAVNTSLASDNTDEALNKSNYSLVGEGTMKVLFFDLYHAKLYASKAQLTNYDLFEIEYLKDIPAKKLIDATEDQWQHIGLTNSEIPNWLRDINRIWPDINKGETLILKRNANGQAEFFHQGKYIGTVSDAAFTDAFLAIWLSEKTSEPKLRKQLLGQYE
jgi:hypothetical protein